MTISPLSIKAIAAASKTGHSFLHIHALQKTIVFFPFFYASRLHFL